MSRKCLYSEGEEVMLINDAVTTYVIDKVHEGCFYTLVAPNTRIPEVAEIMIRKAPDEEQQSIQDIISTEDAINTEFQIKSINAQISLLQTFLEDPTITPNEKTSHENKIAEFETKRDGLLNS